MKLFLLLLAFATLAYSGLFVVTPGDFSPLNITTMPSAAYQADLVDYLLDVPDPIEKYQATIVLDGSAAEFYYSDPTYSYYFLANGTYLVEDGVCVIIPGSNYYSVAEEFGQNLQASIYNLIDIPFAYEYFGLVDLIGLPNAMSVILDTQGYFISADFAGPYNTSELFNNILQSSYSITNHVPIGSTDWAVIPPLPSPCITPTSV